MLGVKHFTLPVALTMALWLLGNGSVPVPSTAADNSDATLFARSIQQALHRSFPSSDISFLLLDARSGHVIAARWDHLETPISMGSLLKPFTAVAYGEHHNFQYPSHICYGTTSGCWRPRGHGKMNLTWAIAYSCNSYFRLLTAGMTASDVDPTARRFGLEAPPDNSAGAELAGLGTRWRVSPLNLARGYLDLVHQRDNAAVGQIVEGMAESAQRGPAAGVGRAFHESEVLAKTGTAVCAHSPHAPGDGFTVVLLPADQPRVLLMVRVHGAPGSQAARVAGQMLLQIEY